MRSCALRPKRRGAVDESAFAQAIARAAPAHPALWMLSVGEPDDPAWLPATDLGDEAHLKAMLARVGDALGVRRLDVLAQWMAEWLGWVAGQPQVALLAAERSVPIVEPDGAAILFIPSGHPAGLRVRTPRLTTLDGDAEALAALLVAQTATLIAPALATLARIGRRPRRALWRGASDRVGHAFAVEVAAASAPELLDVARTVLSAPGPLQASPEYRDVPPHGLMHVRRGCCLAHVEGTPPCLACPLIDDIERARRPRSG